MSKKARHERLEKEFGWMVETDYEELKQFLDDEVEKAYKKGQSDGWEKKNNI